MFEKDRLSSLFVIIAQPRSGSTLLADSLHRHPNIICHDEIFSETVVHGYRPKDGTNIPQPSKLLVERNNDPEQFLCNYILPDKESGIQIGFKVVYSDLFAANSLAKFLMKFILSENIRVIHLRRLNQLRCFVSVERMRRLGVVHSNNSSQSSSLLDLDKDGFLKFLLMQDGNSDFVSRSMNTIAQPRYEHLRQGYNVCLDALGVRRFPFSEGLERMSSQSLSDSVSNAPSWYKWDFPRPSGFVQYTD